MPRRGEAPWGGAESMPQAMARHPLLDPCGPGRTLDRLVINRPWQMMTPPPGSERLSRDMTTRLRVRRSFHHIDNRHRKIKSVGFSVPEASSCFLQIKNPKSTIINRQSTPGNRWSAPHTHAGLQPTQIPRKGIPPSFKLPLFPPPASPPTARRPWPPPCPRSTHAADRSFQTTLKPAKNLPPRHPSVRGTPLNRFFNTSASMMQP